LDFFQEINIKGESRRSFLSICGILHCGKSTLAIITLALSKQNLHITHKCLPSPKASYSSWVEVGKKQCYEQVTLKTRRF
jgi:hypothetical protein